MPWRKPWEIEDGLWERIEPLLAEADRRSRYPHRQRLDDRATLCGILYVLYTGIAWESLPQELGFGTGIVCRQQLHRWRSAGVWDDLHQVLFAELQGSGHLDWAEVVIDGPHMRAAQDSPEPSSDPSIMPSQAETPRNHRPQQHPAGYVPARCQRPFTTPRWRSVDGGFSGRGCRYT